MGLVAFLKKDFIKVGGIEGSKEHTGGLGRYKHHTLQGVAKRGAFAQVS